MKSLMMEAEMAGEMKRVVILLPEEEYDRFKEEVESQYETMSNIGRRLILQWLRDQEPKQEGRNG
jgi:hypothetical protein